MSTDTIYINNDTLFTLDALWNRDTLTFINDATVNLTIKNDAGEDTTGITWPIVLTYVAASDGIYKGIVDKAIVLVEDGRYHAEITSVSGTNDGFWDLLMIAKVRDS